MEIKKFVKIFKNVLPKECNENLIRFAKFCKYEETRIGGIDQEGVVNFDIRKTLMYPLTNFSNSLSNVHWHNFLCFNFGKYLHEYSLSLKILDFTFTKLENLAILKYENTGFYDWHTDHFAAIPRTMSCILLLNNDYEGGNLCFRNPDGSKEWEVEVESNTMIIWPSNFLYPHTVKPVTKGTRYSVVAWAL